MVILVGAVIYADDITLLGPTRSSILSMLSVCDVYAKKIWIFYLIRRKPIVYFFPSISHFTSRTSITLYEH